MKNSLHKIRRIVDHLSCQPVFNLLIQMMPMPYKRSILFVNKVICFSYIRKTNLQKKTPKVSFLCAHTDFKASFRQRKTNFSVNSAQIIFVVKVLAARGDNIQNFPNYSLNRKEDLIATLCYESTFKFPVLRAKSLTAHQCPFLWIDSYAEHPHS